MLRARVLPPKTRSPPFTQISTINLQERTQRFNSLPPTARQWMSVLRGCVQEPQTDGDSYSGVVALAWLETDTGCWLANGADKIWTKGAARSSFLHEIGALGLFTDQPKAPNFPQCPAVHQPYHRWCHLASRGEWLSDCWVYGILPPGRWIH